jgi:undecaprenyl phosphate-alpha-L-ara4FN deformylase
MPGTIALKVDADTLRGTREGVPRLLELFARHRVRATFLFSLGPDHTGWALARVFRRGFLGKVARTSVLRHYGWRTLSHGVLLPAPDIGRAAAVPMREAQAAGHECGIHTWDHVVWQDHVRRRDAAWTREVLQRAWDRFGDVFGCAPATHGAAGWQANEACWAQLDAWGLRHASDGRGRGPYVPLLPSGECRHVQMPTTLPTMDECLGLEGCTEANVHQHLLRATASAGRLDHVFTLHAELEGQLLAPAFEALLQGWRDAGHRLVALEDQAATLTHAELPRHPMAWGPVPGRSGELVVQPDR